jgi:four helix bundle protein
MPLFDHERLDVYRVSIDFIALVESLLENLPRGRAYLGDQMQRAATSIALNIAEGAGEFSAKDKARFYRMALRSARECAALLDVMKTAKLANAANLSSGRELLLRVVQMLTKRVKNLRDLPGRGTGYGEGDGIGDGNGMGNGNEDGR